MPQNKKIFIGLLAVIFLTGFQPGFRKARLFGQGSSQGTGSNNDVAGLVKSLGNPRFEVRERSASALLEIGPAAVDALKHIPEEWPKEIRQRAANVLTEIEKRHLVHLSHVFLLDPDGEQSHGLPAWHAFRELAGVSRSSKLLYLDLIKSQYRLAEQIEELHRQQKLGNDISEGLEQVTRSAREQANVLLPRIFRGFGLDIGDAAALLLAVSAMESTAPVEISQYLYSAVQVSFGGYLNRPGYRQCLQKLLSEWVPRTHDELAPEIMRIAFDLDLPVVLPIARRHLSSVFDKSTREYAIFCISKFGDVTDVAELLKWTDDTTIVHEFDDNTGGIAISFGAPPGTKLESNVVLPQRLVRINDMAAAAAMILLDQDPQKLFPQFSREAFFNRTLFDLATKREEAERRTAEIRAWAEEQLAKARES